MISIQSIAYTCCVIVALLSNSRCLAQEVKSDSLGYNKNFPIKVGSAVNGGPQNQRTYLRQLVDTKGRDLKFMRLGSCCSYASEESPLGMATIDVYRIYFFEHDLPLDSTTLFITFYEYERPTTPPKGFTFKTNHTGDSLEVNEYNLTRRYGTAKKLSLTFEKFKKVPSYVFDLPNLEELSLAYNSNLTELPKEISNLKKLKILELQSTSIKSFPIEISELDSLEELHLSGNMDWDKVFDVLSKCKNLKTISWWDAGLKEISKSIVKCQSIQNIDLKNNFDLDYAKEFKTLSSLMNLREITIGSNDNKMPAGISQLQSLKILNVENCDIKELSGEIASLKNLEQLHIKYCREIRNLPSQMRYCTKLQKLSLYSLDEHFDFAGSLNLLSNCNLKYLDLSQNWRLKKIPDAVFRFKNLEYLGLNIYETDSIPHQIGNLQNLKEIVLGPTNFKFLPVEFGKLSSLKKIDLSGRVDFDYEQVFSVLSQLDSLEEIIIDWGEQKIPDSIANLRHLKRVVVTNYPRKLLDMDRLKRLAPQCEFVY